MCSEVNSVYSYMYFSENSRECSISYRLALSLFILKAVIHDG